ncbi:MAG: hypothetical protein ACRCTI_18285, partial [Beijerinckiaceae bacterium]
FVIRRADLMAYAEEAGVPAIKRDAWAIESGPNSLTRWMERRGKVAVVVDRDGAVHQAPAWASSGPFRTPGQPKLLIADNQTRGYEGADREARQIMEISAWGRAVTP